MREENKSWSSIWDQADHSALLAQAARKLQLDEDCVVAFADAEKRIFANPVAEAALKNAAIAMVEEQETLCKEQARLAADESGVCYHTVVAVMLIHAIALLMDIYTQKNYSQELLWETMIDLRCKFREQHAIDGVWGTIAVGWYVRVFTGKIVKLGRLEFEQIGYKWETPYCGIRKGDPVINMHIPSTGPMKQEDVLDSFRQAYRFFGYTGLMPVAAGSWLLYPPVCQEVFLPGSNLKNFYEMFDLVESYEDPENHNFCRIYNMEYEEGVLDRVPLDTTLRRNLHSFMRTGRNMGVGRAMLRFDGEKVVKA